MTLLLAEFFTMHHPGHDADTGGRKHPSAENLIFTAQCWGFVKFLEDTYGLVVMQEMLELAQKDKPVEDALGVKKLGLPDTLDAFDAAWREWAEKQWGK